ncbi:MAG: glutaredoxin family protein [Methylomonas sp.]|jgi:hypothetical protein|uniref:glutaredoxin family protein n=1 Tax=Methylomonas sp. TaxID=418 RepID=UPI0025CC41B0|nr:glutaredoxin family protein [Methylomonas sp.]MCK9606884.1 glutaredoxin family protein [Methylomonas sp.]
MSDLVLFGTEGCHLCEEAENLVDCAELKVEKRDIMDDESWQQRYGIRIPVLRNQANGHELNWPFSIEQLQLFVSDCA